MTDERYQITPKGKLAMLLMEHVSMDVIDEVWAGLVEFAEKRKGEDYPSARWPAIIIDNDGGTVIGVSEE